jgi:hypothetical protein
LRKDLVGGVEEEEEGGGGVLELEETHKFSSSNSSFVATAAAAGEGGVGVGGEGEMSFVFRGSRGDLETGLHNLMPDRRNNSSSSSSNMVRGCFFLDYSSRYCLSLLFFSFFIFCIFFVLQLDAILFFSFFASLALLICSSTIQEKAFFPASETNMSSSRNCHIEPQNFMPEKLSNLQLRRETQEKSCFRKQDLVLQL